MKEIAIKMPDEMYDWFVNGFPDKVDLDELQRLVINGTVLPKGHGDLIDRDVLKCKYVGWYNLATGKSIRAVQTQEIDLMEPIIGAKNGENE